VEQVLLRRKDAAGVVSVSLPTLDKLIRQGQVKAIRVGRAVLIPRSSLERFGGSVLRCGEHGPAVCASPHRPNGLC